MSFDTELSVLASWRALPPSKLRFQNYRSRPATNRSVRGRGHERKREGAEKRDRISARGVSRDHGSSTSDGSRTTRVAFHSRGQSCHSVSTLVWFSMGARGARNLTSGSALTLDETMLSGPRWGRQLQRGNSAQGVALIHVERARPPIQGPLDGGPGCTEPGPSYEQARRVAEPRQGTVGRPGTRKPCYEYALRANGKGRTHSPSPNDEGRPSTSE